MPITDTAFTGVPAILRRQIKLVLASAATVLLIVLLYLLNATPIFSASTLIYVDPSNKDLLTSEGTASLSGTAENARLESEVEILRSNKVMLATIERAALLQDPQFGPHLSRIDKLKMALGMPAPETGSGNAALTESLRRLSEATTIRRRGLTYLITVTVASPDRQQAAELANVMSQAYIDLQITAKTDAALASRDVLQAQIDRARGQLSQSEANFDRFIDDNLDRLEQEIGTEEFSNLRQAYQDARDNSLAAQSRLQTAQAALDRRNWDGLLDTLSSEAMTSLDRQRREIRDRLSGTTPGSTQAVNLRASLLEIETELERTANDNLTALESTLAGLRENSASLQGNLRTALLQGNLSPDSLSQIYALQQEADIAQRQYRTLLTRMRDLEAQAQVQVADSRIVSPAIAPLHPSAPKTGLLLGLAILAALAVGTGLALLYEYVVGGVVSQQQLNNVLPVRALATVPKADLAPGQSSVADLIVDQPLSAFAESLRRIKAGLDQAQPGRADKTARVIMVTSAVSAEGKSSLSLALARTYAATGKRVLLIDADLRKPTQHLQIGHAPDTGFIDYLQNPQNTDPDNLSFYVADPKSDSGVILGRGQSRIPTDQLLQSSAFENLIKQARSQMDVILIDTAPLLPVVDARYVAPMVDEVLLCVRYGRTSQGALRDAYAQLTEAIGAETAVFSVLNLNRFKTSGYSYYGSYGTQATAPAAASAADPAPAQG